MTLIGKAVGGQCLGRETEDSLGKDREWRKKNNCHAGLGEGPGLRSIEQRETPQFKPLGVNRFRIGRDFVVL